MRSIFYVQSGKFTSVSKNSFIVKKGFFITQALVCEQYFYCCSCLRWNILTSLLRIATNDFFLYWLKPLNYHTEETGTVKCWFSFIWTCENDLRSLSEMEANVSPALFFSLYITTTTPKHKSHSGENWDKRRRQLDLLFQWIDGGDTYCSLSAGGLSCEAAGASNEDIWRLSKLSLCHI